MASASFWARKTPLFLAFLVSGATAFGLRPERIASPGRAVPSMHIIVKNGHGTLEGAVANKGDADAAVIRAKTVPGVFSVDSRLRTDAQS
ncbi:MAG TPA: BON domain-containing protein [Bryobacteraceae bacterium]